ncbi:molybdenum cofactor biosynthesis protein MoaE [Blastomonas sp.]|uniref:molybdenum cofactor biosynthesis protein MoaE n=1 Tax=Blastomonas sp. TaxID=1909299 RepID=UPI0035941A61
MRERIRIASAPFDPEEEMVRFRAQLADAGAVVSFLGLVRARNAAGAVTALSLQHYPGMTERDIGDALNEAASRWALEAALVIHRIGDLAPAEPIVLVATASKHRRAAFEAADFLMDHLKCRALFWKCETGEGGRSWIEPRTDDYADAARWDG